MDREDAQHAKMLEDRMQAIREDFIRAGMPKADIDWLVSNMWTQAHTPTIQTLEQYRLVAKTYTALDASIPKGDTRSPEAVRLAAIGGSMIEFEGRYKEEHGKLPS